jgi:hypothetical protein
VPQLPSPTDLPTGKSHLNGRLVGTQSQSRRFGAEINILHLPGSEARFLDYPTLAVTHPAPTITPSSYKKVLKVALLGLSTAPRLV